jgi:hypothetical protein
MCLGSSGSGLIRYDVDPWKGACREEIARALGAQELLRRTKSVHALIMDDSRTGYPAVRYFASRFARGSMITVVNHDDGCLDVAVPGAVEVQRTAADKMVMLHGVCVLIVRGDVGAFLKREECLGLDFVWLDFESSLRSEHRDAVATMLRRGGVASRCVFALTCCLRTAVKGSTYDDEAASALSFMTGALYREVGCNVAVSTGRYGHGSSMYHAVFSLCKPEVQIVDFGSLRGNESKRAREDPPRRRRYYAVRAKGEDLRRFAASRRKRAREDPPRRRQYYARPGPEMLAYMMAELELRLRNKTL